MKYRLVSETQKSFIVQHPNGTHIEVAKSGIDKGQHARIKKLEPIKMSDGGEVPSLDDTQALNSKYGIGADLSAQAEPIPVNLGGSSIPDGALSPQTPSAMPGPTDMISPFTVMPQAQSDAFTPPPAPTADAQAVTSSDSQQAPPTPDQQSARSPASMMPTPTGMGEINGIMGGIRSANNTIAKAQANQYHETQAALEKSMQAQEQLHQEYQKQYSAVDQELNANKEAFAQGKVDPNRIWNNAGTGNKVMAGIGLVLGGIGSALTGQPNAALQVLEKTMDRDMEAQKANIDKQKTLFSMNMERYKNVQAAEAATRLQMSATLQSQIAIAAAKSGSAQAMAHAQLANKEIEMKMLPYKQQVANYQMAQSLRGSADPAAQAMLVRLTVDPKHQEQAFKELAMAENHAKQSSTILAAFDQSDKDNTFVGRAMRAGYTPPSVARLQTAMMPYLKDAEGRINEQELERTDKLIPRPGDSAQTIAQKKLGMQQFLQEKSSFPMLKAYGIRVPEMANASGQSSIKEFAPVK